MFDTLPTHYQDAFDWDWEQWHPYFETLNNTVVTEDNVVRWLQDCDTLKRLVYEVRTRLYVATNVDTTDDDADARLKNFMRKVNPHVQQQFSLLDKKLVASGAAPDAIKVPLRNIEASLKIFTDDNLALQTRLSELQTAYNKLSGARTVEWEGEDVPIAQLRKVLQSPDRDLRKKAFFTMNERLRQDREAVNTIWEEMVDLRQQLATNAGLDNYRQYAWLNKNRHDYSPEEALEFTEAVAEVAVPADTRRMEKIRTALAYDTFYAWDTNANPDGAEPLKAYDEIEELIETTASIFQQIDPDLGAQFGIMQAEGLLDLDNRKGKAPGGYMTYFAQAERPFIFMNATGLAGDITVLLHEGGHAFHGFATQHVEFTAQRDVPSEFAEVAAMAMELLAFPYLTKDKGGFFDDADAARYKIDHLNRIIRLLPSIAMIVEFQHWVYTHLDAARNTENCDNKWFAIHQKYRPHIDITGYEDDIAGSWRQVIHLFSYPFYYIEYGLAQLGAIQVWANAKENQATALAAYREALALGGTVTLPELYAAAGAKLAFDAETMGAAIALVEVSLKEFETSQ